MAEEDRGIELTRHASRGRARTAKTIAELIDNRLASKLLTSRFWVCLRGDERVGLDGLFAARNVTQIGRRDRRVKRRECSGTLRHGAGFLAT